MSPRRALYSPRDWDREAAETDPVGEEEPYRTPARRDYARLIHSPAFRRLQGKTQLFPGEESDFFRNRLTHSLEVAQVSKSIALRLNHLIKKRHPRQAPKLIIDTDLVEFAGLAHDLGHPPFGHTGEAVLDHKMKQYGGFEGNAQTLRILSRLEKRKVKPAHNDGPNQFNEFREGQDVRRGLNVTYRALASILKYDNRIPERRAGDARLAKGYYSSEAGLVRKIKDAVLAGHPPKRGEKFKTIEMQIMDLADDITYSTYDFEDAMKAGFTSPLNLMSKLNRDNELLEAVSTKLFYDENKRYYQAKSPSDDDRTKFARIKTQVINVVRDLFKGLIRDTAADMEGKLKELVANRPSHTVEATAFAERFSEYSALQLESLSSTLQENAYNRSLFTSQLVGQRIRSIDIEVNADCPAVSTVKISKEIEFAIAVLKHLTYEIQIKSPRLKLVEYRGKEIVGRLFDCFKEDKEGELMPADWRSRVRITASFQENETMRMRLVCDYIAGMTDRHALDVFSRLHSANPSVLFRPH